MDQFDIRRRRLDRRRALADALAGAAVQPSYYQSQLIPGPYGYKVAGAPALAAGIEKAGYLLGSALAGRGADAEEQRIAEEQRQATKDWAGRFLSPSEVAEGDAPPNAVEGAQGPRMPVERPRTKAEQIGLALEGLDIGGPGAMLAGSYLQGALKPPEYKRVEGFDYETGRKTYLNYDASTGQATPTGEIEAPPAPRISLNPKDFTPDSWSRYEQTGKISALSPSTAEAEARLAEIAARAEEERRTRQTPSVSVSYSRSDPESLRLRREELELAKSRPQGPQKPLPPGMAKAYVENNSALAKVDRAIDAVKKSPEATGIKGMLPDVALQRLDPAGVDARAAIADIGSLVIHDRSGAAVTAAEFPRLRPFIPNMTDTKETVQKKLANFRREYEAVQREIEEYADSQGHKSPRKEAASDGLPAPDQTKVIGGKTYVKRGGQWYEAGN